MKDLSVPIVIGIELFYSDLFGFCFLQLGLFEILVK